MSIILLLINDMLFSAVPAVGFAMLFNVPHKALSRCALLGAAGHGLRTLLVYFGVPLVFGTFLGAALIGFIGVLLAKSFRAHPKVFTVAGIIPMIPGVYAYRSMIALFEIHQLGYSPERFAHLLDNFVLTAFLLTALVFGLALPGMLFYRSKPII